MIAESRDDAAGVPEPTGVRLPGRCLRLDWNVSRVIARHDTVSMRSTPHGDHSSAEDPIPRLWHKSTAHSCQADNPRPGAPDRYGEHGSSTRRRNFRVLIRRPANPRDRGPRHRCNRVGGMPSPAGRRHAVTSRSSTPVVRGEQPPHSHISVARATYQQVNGYLPASPGAGQTSPADMFGGCCAGTRSGIRTC